MATCTRPAYTKNPSRLGFLGNYLSDVGRLEAEKPIKGADKGPVPVHPVWRENVFILKWCMIPLVAQYALLKYTPFKIQGLVPIILQFAIYQLLLFNYGSVVTWRTFRFAKEYGTLNEEVSGRNIVDGERYTRITHAFYLYSIVRNLGMFLSTKDFNAIPHLDLMSPIRIFAWLVVMEYIYFLYHYCVHKYDFLWQFHRQHHAARAPQCTLGIYSSDVQDALEWAVIPWLACKAVPLSFAELHLVAAYTTYMEGFIHSGIRAYWPHPLLGPLLKPVGMDLIIEDHDIHHRYGRAAENFGKQTRIWDVIFGTSMNRLEEAEYNERKVAAAAAQE